MTEETNAPIIPADYPELKELVQDQTTPLSPEDAFAIYERNWRFLDRSRLTEKEARLIRELTERFGKGELYV